MNESQQPGIVFKSITLLRSNFRADSKPKDFKFRLELVGIERRLTERADGSGSDTVCVFDFDLMYGIKDAPCELTCSYMAHYFRADDANMPWDQFTDGMALSHVIAYVREFVMNITTRSMLPRIFINPLNANALVSRCKRRTAEADQK